MMTNLSEQDREALRAFSDSKAEWFGFLDAIGPELEDIVRRARAEALREAARALPGFDSIRTHGDAAKWLRDRANAEQAPGDAQEAAEGTSSSLAGHGDADGGVRGGGA